MNEHDRLLVQDTMAKFDQLKTRRKPWESVWEEVARYVVPKRINMEVTDSRQAGRAKEVYSSAAPQALALMCNGLIGYMVSWSTPRCVNTSRT